MKQITLIIASLIIIMSCGNGAQNRIVSETPIKTDVFGLRLGEPSSQKAIENALTKEVGKSVYGDSQKDGVGTTVRAFPLSLEINYGGLSWHYLDVSLNEDKQIVQIALVGSFESVERARDQFEAAKEIFTQKYGKGNNNEEYQNIFWTDDKNSVGITYQESSAINGNDRSFCTLYYVNIDMATAFEEANTPDI